MTQLVDHGAADEARSSRDQDSHGRRVYWRAFLLLAATLLAAGCHGSKHRTPEPKLSFLELDRMQQRLVADYVPVSRALATYQLDYRDWGAGRLSLAALRGRARAFRTTVSSAATRVRRESVSGKTARAKTLLLESLAARRRALAATPGSEPYQADWNRSVVAARQALTTLQDIRDAARLIPLPEDSIS